MKISGSNHVLYYGLISTLQEVTTLNKIERFIIYVLPSKVSRKHVPAEADQSLFGKKNGLIQLITRL